uniref:Cytochrome P450 n=1 Tax=Oryza punctata TaxID=4537 RepID=A0A0E0M9P5_ORYPU
MNIVGASQWLLLLVAFLVSLFILLSLRGGGRVPPGPLAVPVLGNLLWLWHSAADLEPLLRRLIARHGPVVSLRVGSRLSIFVADRRVAHAVLVERGAALADRPEVTRALLGENGNTITRANYGPTWRLLRRGLVSETLHPSRARVFAPARSWVRRVLVGKLGESGKAPHSVMDTLQYAMFCLLVVMCFGERLDEADVRAIATAQHDWIVHFATKMRVFAFCSTLTKHLFRGRIKMALALRRRQKELFMPLINARRERKRRTQPTVPDNNDTTFEHSYVDTLLDLRLSEDENRALTDKEMVSLCSEFLDAGTDTTSTALQWIMAELVKNPSVQAKLYDEIKATISDDHREISEEDSQKMPYLKAVILEGLRKHPPGHFVLEHKAAEDIEVGSYLIPKGVAEMGRDEKEWEKPMEFMPERFLAGGDGEGVDVTGSKRIRMMQFGVGRRMCAGLNTAMLHLEYFVANMVLEFEWKEVAGDEVDLAEKAELTTAMAKPLRVQHRLNGLNKV